MHIRKLGLLILAIVLTVGILGLSAGCGSGDASGTGVTEGTGATDGTATTAGTGDAGDVKTYTDTAYGFSFDYPGDWRVSTSETAEVTSGADPTQVVTVGDPNGKKVGSSGVDLCMVRVYELNRAIDEASLSSVLPDLEGLIADSQSQDPTFKIDSPLAETTVGTIPGYQVTGSFDWDADTPVKTTLYFLFAGNIEYQLSVQASTETWEADQAVFDAFIASFKLGTSAN
jgi:hypothetical protein